MYQRQPLDLLLQNQRTQLIRGSITHWLAREFAGFHLQIVALCCDVFRSIYTDYYQHPKNSQISKKMIHSMLMRKSSIVYSPRLATESDGRVTGSTGFISPTHMDLNMM
jgi:hypothetical protein